MCIFLWICGQLLKEASIIKKNLFCLKANILVILVQFRCDHSHVVFICYFAGNFGEVVDVELVMDRAVSLKHVLLCSRNTYISRL